MPIPKKHKLSSAISATIPLVLTMGLIGCGEDNTDPDDIGTPNSYEFRSLINPADSSVNYEKATAQYILIRELEHLIASQAFFDKAQTSEGYGRAILNKVYEGGVNTLKSEDIYNDSELTTSINGFDESLELLQRNYLSLPSNVNLKSSMPGESIDLYIRDEDEPNHGLFLGWNVAGLKDESQICDSIIQDWFKRLTQLARKSDNITYRLNGIDYQALITSFLSTSIPYFQVSNNLLHPDKGLQADNTLEDSFTELQHNWDLAFGYFGANRDFKNQNLMADAYDLNGDEIIDLFSEFNFIHAHSSMKIDTTADLATTNYSKKIIQAFLTGRQLIGKHLAGELNDNELESQLNAQAQIIRLNWEEVIAAELVHYLNITVQAGLLTATYGESFAGFYAKNWAYAKSYSLALQMNPLSRINYEELTQNDGVLLKMGQSPEIRESNISTYTNKLLVARDLIANIYSFPPDYINW